MASPTQRTLKHLRDGGWTAAVVEKWNPHANIRQDLFGCVDIVAMTIGENGVLGVQACAGASHTTRRDKLLASPLAKLWVQCGNGLAVVSWAKQGPRGKAKRWLARWEWIVLPMFTTEAT